MIQPIGIGVRTLTFANAKYIKTGSNIASHLELRGLSVRRSGYLAHDEGETSVVSMANLMLRHLVHVDKIHATHGLSLHRSNRVQ